MRRFGQEVVLPAGLWIYFLVKAILMGRELAHRDLRSLEALPPGPFALLLVLCLGLGAVFPFLNARLQSSRVDRFLERLFGAESYAVICRRLPANLLAGAFFVLAAASGLYVAARMDAPGVNRQVLQSLFAISAGIAVSAAVRNRRGPRP
jgi:hypothetical protein